MYTIHFQPAQSESKKKSRNDQMSKTRKLTISELHLKYY